MTKPITIRPLQDADIPMMTAWLHKDYILTWYHDPEDWLTEIDGRSGEYAWIHHFIVMEGDTPVGFCQYYDCYDANDMEDWYEVTEPSDTYSIDYLIGDEAYLGKGYGKAIVALLTETIGKLGQVRRIVVQPDTENHASNGVLLANGYVYDAEHAYYVKVLRA